MCAARNYQRLPSIIGFIKVHIVRWSQEGAELQHGNHTMSDFDKHEKESAFDHALLAQLLAAFSAQQTNLPITPKATHAQSRNTDTAMMTADMSDRGFVQQAAHAVVPETGPTEPMQAPTRLKGSNRLPPRENTARIMANALPRGAKISEEAKILAQAIMAEFILATPESHASSVDRL